VRALRQDDPAFPRELLLVEKPPEVLYAQGDLSLLTRPKVAIIGSRHPSPYGIRAAYEAARSLAGQGMTVVSGMAIGLDARAHRGALDANGGTIAVLGCGVDVDYPPSNRSLLEETRARGLVLSEYPPGAKMRPWHFPARNRLIAGLAQCLVVVEGRILGGTSNTVKWALDLGVKVLAVPGHIGDELASGPNLLIREGAGIYLHPNDVLRRFALPLLPEDTSPAETVRAGARASAQQRAELTGAEAALYDLITPDPLHVDVLGARSAIEPGLLLAALSSLELQGLVTQLPGKHFALAS
jgi:DNA processing protein